MGKEKLIFKPETKLERAVAKWIRSHTEPGYAVESVLHDLFYGGCQSGMVSDLIYYSDTIKFYKRHKADISALLKDALSNYGNGSSPQSVFGDKWDADDPLADDTNNQNLLAWFGFEEAARNLASRAGYND